VLLETLLEVVPKKGNIQGRDTAAPARQNAQIANHDATKCSKTINLTLVNDITINQ